MNKEFDIAIIGGGMVGATAGCCLGGSKLKVAVIEQIIPHSFALDQPHDLRVSALNIASQTILQQIGAWKGVLNRRYCPFKRMRVWETAGDTEFNCKDINRNELGFIVENRIIQLALLDRLAELDNIELIAPATIKKIDYDGIQPTAIELDDGSKITAKVIVAADGGNSRVRKLVNIGVTSWDYKQHAMVISIETDYEQQDITWQRFLPSGPQAFLPLSGNCGSLVWYNSAEVIKRLKSLSNKALIAEISAAFPKCLGTIKQVLAVSSFPLKRQHAQQYIKTGVALVGDAAHMINPLAGQGVNIGLLDAAVLAEVLIDAHVKGEDLADMGVLNRYEEMRRNKNLGMMTVMDAFYRVFSNDTMPLKFIRNLGLGMVERVFPAKNKIMRIATGLNGKLPKLARGESIL
ncbi:MAG: 2-octaprenyl-3-methyl-6-methoxy-1,4-benzoquinol hydroxylase [Methylococcales symbiont of Iophon sp. n. MRB-2018]|nr:MAG: 2-octaprenyl-3-methyl-6-methoxy-1,4-benzoquinol hydroxylase [Methylococcales symbiont of Iophon sp. n. MRB-2018]